MVSDKQLSKIIMQVSKKYSTPVFRPHLTLISEVRDQRKEVIEKTARLVEGIYKIELKSQGLDYSDKFFRSLFIKIKATPELKKLNLKVKKIFGVKQKFSPHISLMYGNIPENIKKQIMKKIGKFGSLFKVDSICLMEDNYRQLRWPTVKKFALK